MAEKKDPDESNVSPIMTLKFSDDYGTGTKYGDKKLPTMIESRPDGIVFYGAKNDFPDQLIDLYNRSPKHNAIISHKAKFIAGKEILIENGDQSLIDKFNQYDSIGSFMDKITLDDLIFSAIAVEVVYDNAKRPTYYHLNAGNVRTLNHRSYEYWPKGKDTKRDEVVEYDRYDLKKVNPARPLRDGTKPDKKFKWQKQLIYVMGYRAGRGVYPLPEYIGAKQYIDIDTRIANFHLNNISSGFMAGTLVQMYKGEPTAKMKRDTRAAFMEKTGDDNAGMVVIQWNNRGEEPSKIESLRPADLDKQFLELNNHVQQEIFTGHQITSPQLLGVRIEGQLGGLQELGQAYEIFYNSYIEPRQQRLAKFMTELIKDMGKTGTVKITKAEPIGQDYLLLFEKGLITAEQCQEFMGLPVNGDAGTTSAGQTKTKPADKKKNDEIPAKFEADDETNLWHDDDVHVFNAHGHLIDGYEIVDMMDLQFAKIDRKSGLVLSVINGNDGATRTDIAAATKLDVSEVDKILKKLADDGKINMTGNSRSITDDGRADIKNNDLSQLILRWKYELDPKAPPLQPGGESRPFCVKMMELSAAGRVYSRADMAVMTAKLGYDVFKRRGGWYHNPETNVNIPHCRHDWRQVVLRRK